MDTPAYTPEQLLAALRSGESDATHARELLAASDDANAARLRLDVAQLLASAILPGDHALAQWLLKQETRALKRAGSGSTETLITLVAVVARFADPHDAILIWRAREATPETRENIDVEQMARAGIERVRAHLSAVARADTVDAHDAAAALRWLDAGVAEGIDADLAGYFMWSDERFGLHVSGPT